MLRKTAGAGLIAGGLIGGTRPGGGRGRHAAGLGAVLVGASMLHRAPKPMTHASFGGHQSRQPIKTGGRVGRR